jgi:hypothetical protein
MHRSTNNQQEIARSRKATSDIKYSMLEQLNTLCMGVGTSCQVPFCDSLTLISNTNVNHQHPFGDDKSQPLD